MSFSSFPFSASPFSANNIAVSSFSTYNETMNGGVLGGGTAVVLATYNYSVTSAGVLCAGTGGISLVTSFTPTSGVLCAGSGNISLVISFTPTSGVLCAGSGVVQATYKFTPTSGVLCAGSGGISLVTSFTPTSGVLCGGTAPFAYLANWTMSGGALCAGTAVVQARYKVTPSNGAVISGYSLIESGVFVQSAGVVGGSSAVVSFVVTLKGSGGAIIGGSAPNSKDFIMLGGVVVGHGKGTFSVSKLTSQFRSRYRIGEFVYYLTSAEPLQFTPVQILDLRPTIRGIEYDVGFGALVAEPHLIDRDEFEKIYPLNLLTLAQRRLHAFLLLPNQPVPLAGTFAIKVATEGEHNPSLQRVRKRLKGVLNATS